MKKQNNNRRFILYIYFCLCIINLHAQSNLPNVFSDHTLDKLGSDLRGQAKIAASSVKIGTNAAEFLSARHELKSAIISNAKVRVDNDIPLDFMVTGTIHMDAFRIENIRFQSGPGVYATANLYIPDGKGPFPAVINMHGHWPNGRRTEITQITAQFLALNGYVCLNIDAWGAGERGTNEHEHEYHGSNLGASLLDVDETLMGMQLADNIRGVDLLCSLPYVDKENIGATGASGGGNQTMWLSAIDNRIKAAVPVVSIGSFESYIMNSNCVCELLPNGLAFTEEDGVLGLIAPRALKILTAMNDANPSFSYLQMLGTYHSSLKIYDALNQPDKITYQLFNTGHGYWPEMQLAMIDWFNIHLKGNSTVVKRGLEEVKFLPIEELATYPKGERDKKVLTTADYCRIKGNELRQSMLSNNSINPVEKKNRLKEILSLKGKSTYREIHHSSDTEGWRKIIIETEDGRLIPLLYTIPAGNDGNYTIISHPFGKDSIPQSILDGEKQKGNGLILVDLWGTGESRSNEAVRIDGALPPFHTLSRSALWLGQTVIGNWVNELTLVHKAAITQLNAQSVKLIGFKETAVASLLFNALNNYPVQAALYNAPISYLFDSRASVDHFNMAIHIPGFLEWGDISLAAAISNADITFIRPVTMSGHQPEKTSRTQIEKEFATLKKKAQSTGKTTFIWE